MEISRNTFRFLLLLNLVLIIDFVNASPNNELDLGDSCILQDNARGTCKKHHDCDYAKQLFIEKKTREIMRYRCKFSRRIPYVCCPNPVSRIDEDLSSENILETTTKEDTTTTTQPIEQHQSISIEETSTAAVRKTGPTRYQKALCENETPEIALGQNIVGGERADIGEFPFQAAIGYRDVSEGENAAIKYNCGGSLIAEDVVISAAHCFGMKQSIPETVKLGRTALSYDDEDDYSDGDDVEIEKVIMHPQYSRLNKLNDIALIKLKRAFNSTRFPLIKPICLSTNDENLPENFTITGFGKSDVDTRKTSDWLLKATVNEILNEECNKMMLGVAKIIETQTCALGHKGADSCQGDSGGPLSFERDNGGGKLTYLHGIVSYGASCGSAFPGIYTKVNKYLGWIEQELNLME